MRQIPFSRNSTGSAWYGTGSFPLECFYNGSLLCCHLSFLIFMSKYLSWKAYPIEFVFFLEPTINDDVHSVSSQYRL